MYYEILNSMCNLGLQQYLFNKLLMKKLLDFYKIWFVDCSVFEMTRSFNIENYFVEIRKIFFVNSLYFLFLSGIRVLK